jgi:5-methylcytosine-specific restriction endonuclease McrA
MLMFRQTLVLASVFTLGLGAQAWALDCSQFAINPMASMSLGAPVRSAAGGCAVLQRNGLPVPDPRCTPGAINPTVTAAVLANPEFRTRCVRNNATTEAEKAAAYTWYDQPHPRNNRGPDQTCELDHLVPLELGGADTLDNIWPQCGPAGVPLPERFFKRKDTVENYLSFMVKHNETGLAAAQRGIAANWTQYLAAAEAMCPGGRCPYR